MSAPDPELRKVPAQQEWFTTTHWSVVLAAGHSTSPGSQAALESLCQTYWYPLYLFVRRQGYTAEQAQDLTQDFFAYFLENKYFRLADRGRGKFRSFLLTSLKHFLIHDKVRAGAAKRGGGQQIISWDEHTAETRYGLEPVTNQTAESQFDRRWALTLFERAIHELEAEFVAAGKPRQFQRLKGFLSTETDDGAYAAAASELQMTPGAVAVTVHRLRQRYGELVRAQIAHTVSNPAAIEEELRYLVGLIVVPQP